jgi:hypothetical protein
MNPRPARFRPHLEALEDRSLLTVSVSSTPFLGGIELVIDASQSTAHNAITLVNHGNGHITGGIAGDPNGSGDFNAGAGFANVSVIFINGGAGGTTVSFAQQGEASNPSGDQVYASGLHLLTQFAGGDNTLSATLNGHALRAGTLSFLVNGGGGNDAVSVNAGGVDIAAGTKFSVIVADTFAPPNGRTNFSMDWSGVKRGVLFVRGEAGSDAFADFRLFATFEGASPLHALPGRGAFGAGPGDLSFFGEACDDNNLVMLLHSPGRLPLTGDLGAGTGTNTCLRTANVNLHGSFLPDFIVP